MKALVTGASGTVGSALREHLQRKNFEVIIWNRQEVPIDRYQQMEDFVVSVQPDIIYHLAQASKSTGIENEGWKVNYEWTSELAWISQLLKIRFLFTSTNLVFSTRLQGPFNLQSVPDAEEGYGYEKRKAEERIFHQNKNAIVVRLGWQIGHTHGSNNMIDYFDRKTKEFGEVRAGIHWYPPCSFLEDTCEQLIDIGMNYKPGIYMLDSNERWNLFEIAKALSHSHGHRWKIVPSEDYKADQRMIDERMRMISLKNRLPMLH